MHVASAFPKLPRGAGLLSHHFLPLTSTIRCCGANLKATLHGKELEGLARPSPSCPLSIVDVKTCRRVTAVVKSMSTGTQRQAVIVEHDKPSGFGVFSSMIPDDPTNLYRVFGVSKTKVRDSGRPH